MDVIERLTKQGKDLGYEGETLQTFVKEQQIELRDERKAMREAERYRREAERESREAENAYNKNRYILTLVDYATRYPKAVPLASIDTETVTEALVSIFSRVGIPNEVLTDMGTQYTSAVMKEVSRLFKKSFKQLVTTSYHPICNGLVERFNKTIKKMLMRMCAERPKDWDKYIDPLLFAYREAPQESLGFSPFELLYGWPVREPMQILKQLWSKEIEDPEVRSTYQYVIELRDRLESTLEIAQDNLSKMSRKYKRHFDQKAGKRQLKVGGKALVLLPTDKNKLLMGWKGP